MPVKNTKIFYYFLDPVVKPRDDIECVFRYTQPRPLAMTLCHSNT
ncbi:palindromic element RPE4 domain-containing protein [Rickettsia japonica]|uniref:Palindromic element RPE4 domain-containing protein n=1 Tax=Rickettsia japonica TaxID=35790 RepID=A0ABM6YGM2_RICJA|nr:palindromic element RPE4 domain-containing protein [Rickettsia japonica]